MCATTVNKQDDATNMSAQDLLDEKLRHKAPGADVCDADKVEDSPDQLSPGKADDEGKDGPEEIRKPIEQYSPEEIGAEGERLAASYLERRQFEILERNWTCAAGEVDIVAKDIQDNTVVLVEVKTRLALGEDSRIMPELAVDEEKQNRYRKMALLYLATHMDCYSIRFDVIALNIVGERMAKLRHLLGAFSWDE